MESQRNQNGSQALTTWLPTTSCHGHGYCEGPQRQGVKSRVPGASLFLSKDDWHKKMLWQLFPSSLWIKSKVLIMAYQAPHHLASANYPAFNLITLCPCAKQRPPRPTFSFSRYQETAPGPWLMQLLLPGKLPLLLPTPPPGHGYDLTLLMPPSPSKLELSCPPISRDPVLSYH